MTYKALLLCLVLCLCGRSVCASPSSNIPFEEALESLMQVHASWNLERARLEALSKANTKYDWVMLPKLGVVGNHRSDRRLTRSTGIILNPDELKTEQSVGLQLNWNLFRGGADYYSQSAADYDVAKQASRVQDVFLSAEKENAELLFQFLQLAQEKKAFERITERTAQLLGVTSDQSRAGLITSGEKERHTLELRLAQVRLGDVLIPYRAVEARVRTLLADSTIVERWPWKQKLVHCNFPCGLGDWRENARPDVRAAEQNLEAAEARSKEARGKIFGSLDLNLNFNYTNLVTDDRRGTEWGGQLVYRLPLFDGLENISDYRGALETRKGAEIQSSLLRRQARAEWEAALSGFKEALQVAKERERDRELVERVLDGETKRYRKGQLNLDELGRVFTNSMNVLVAAARAWNNVHQQVVSICHANGKRLAECLPQLNSPTPVGQSVESIPSEPEDAP